MMRTKNSADVARALTRAVKADPNIKKLFNMRVNINDKFMALDDPFIIGEDTIGVLGLINGVLQILDQEIITASINTMTGDIIRFKKANKHKWKVKKI